MELYGKKRALEALDRFSQSGRFPHALLFTGDKGIGKKVLADHTAMMYMCSGSGKKPCMRCNECRRVEQHIHPDVVYPLSAMEKGKYNADGLREFISGCYIKPNDGDIRVCVFESLDEMSVICQNTLLKFIEEPLEFNRYIFTAARKEPILQTVLSRVTAVAVDPVTEQELAKALAEHGISASRAAELYGQFGGNIGTALKYEQNGEEMQYYHAAVKACDAIAEKKELDCLLAMSSLKTREEIFAALGILTDIFAQAAAYKSGKGTAEKYMDRTKRIASTYSLGAISGMYTEALRLYGLSFTNPNVKLFAAECCGALFDAAESANRR
ncbi:MAG: hypothetical protein II820_06580 [Ruminiclostridium sp.]|nr:hypothetical protein [Ruminiclostridium sp.]